MQVIAGLALVINTWSDRCTSCKRQSIPVANDEYPFPRISISRPSWKRLKKCQCSYLCRSIVAYAEVCVRGSRDGEGVNGSGVGKDVGWVHGVGWEFIWDLLVMFLERRGPFKLWDILVWPGVVFQSISIINVSELSAKAWSALGNIR